MGAKVITAQEAVKYINDNDVVSTGGFVQSNNAEAVLAALEERYVSTGSPKNLTLFHAAGQGDGKELSINHFGQEGLLKRVVAGHFNLAPKLGKLIIENKVEAYNLPQGTISQMFRDIAAHKVGTITHVGLNTYVDPRLDGGKLNSCTTEEIVELITIAGQERLFYKPMKVNVAIVRGTYADQKGNVVMTKEVLTGEVTSICQAAKNSGGIVICQVERVVANGTLDPKLVKIPGIYVDYIVECPDQEQYFTKLYDPRLTGEAVVPVDAIDPMPLDERKVIGRRAAMELSPDTIVNLGIGMPESVSAVANEEGIGDWFTLTVEPGPIGGVPQGGRAFGACINPEAIIDQPYQFDFYDGGGLDLAFLGLAQADEKGNINVSKFGTRVAGCGGFINITQNTKKAFFLGTFTAQGLEVEVKDGKLKIINEGKSKKFLKQVEHITFSGEYAVKVSQPVMYITERAVFELKSDGLYLTEIAPGVDMQKDILDLMDFAPKISPDLKTMDERIFKDEVMGLKN